MVRGECRCVRLRVAAAAVWLALVACCLWRFGLSLEALVNALGCAVVVAVTVTDLERRIVPNRIVVPALVVALVVQTVARPVRRVDPLRARRGRILPRPRPRQPGRPRDGGRQAGGVPRCVARIRGRDRAVRRHAPRGRPRARHPRARGSEGANHDAPLRSRPGGGRDLRRSSSGTRCSTRGSAETPSLLDCKRLEDCAPAVVAGERRGGDADASVRALLELHDLARQRCRPEPDGQAVPVGRGDDDVLVLAHGAGARLRERTSHARRALVPGRRARSHGARARSRATGAPPRDARSPRPGARRRRARCDGPRPSPPPARPPSRACFELGGAHAQLGLAQVELGGAVPQDLLHAEVQLARALLATFELFDGLPNLARALLELLPALCDQLDDGVGGLGRREQAPEAAAAACRRACRVPAPAPIPARVGRVAAWSWSRAWRRRRILSRRVRMSRRRIVEFAAPRPRPPQRGRATQPYGGGRPSTARINEVHGCNGCSSPRRTDRRGCANRERRSSSSRTPTTELRAGDRGVVRGIEAGGEVVVEWERGFNRAIDPRQSAFRALRPPNPFDAATRSDQGAATSSS